MFAWWLLKQKGFLFQEGLGWVLKRGRETSELNVELKTFVSNSVWKGLITVFIEKVWEHHLSSDVGCTSVVLWDWEQVESRKFLTMSSQISLLLRELSRSHWDTLLSFFSTRKTFQFHKKQAQWNCFSYNWKLQPTVTFCSLVFLPTYSDVRPIDCNRCSILACLGGVQLFLYKILPSELI